MKSELSADQFRERIACLVELLKVMKNDEKALILINILKRELRTNLKQMKATYLLHLAPDLE